MNYLLLFFSFLLPLVSFSAKKVTVWGTLPSAMVSFNSADSPYTFKPLAHSHNHHQRYQPFYKGLPIWGYQLITHSNPNLPYTGVLFTDLEKDIKTTKTRYNKTDLLQRWPQRTTKINKIIYIDGEKAKIAFLLQYYQLQHKQLTRPTFIVDANTGEVLKTYNALPTRKVGQGPGGNEKDLAWRQGKFYFGTFANNFNQLGNFDVKIANGQCSVENEHLQVFNLKNTAVKQDDFPVTIEDEQENGLRPFTYACGENYINEHDGDDCDGQACAPVNGGYSPINDTMYFSELTIEMYEQHYGLKNPLGTDLPLKAFTHIAELANAFALPTEYDDEGHIEAHQQIIIGNGGEPFFPMSQTTIPHELSHNVTALLSGLIYEGQSGGINEAFSDMADLAMRDYLKKSHDWYWNGEDWTIGREETQPLGSLGGGPLRYMKTPSDDGLSINNANAYYPGIDVHHSSGVFNRAFYLIAHKQGFNAQKAFQLMVDANRNYWFPATDFSYAACGVIQAAYDRAWPIQPVINAFKKVGVKCTV